MYIRDGWYAAAWSDEVTGERPLSRTLLGDPVVLFRDPQGRPGALLDRCPHRLAPLSKGKLLETGLQCPYHGLQFNRLGACTHNPFGSQPPPRAQVRSYPLTERYGMTWIWMGDPGRADPGLIPDLALIDDTAHWHTERGYLLSPGNYLLSIDNLMDLTHPEFVHDGSLGSPALKTAHYQVTAEGPRTVHSNRWFDSGPIPPAMDRVFPSGGEPVSHWVDMRWDAPSNLWLHTGVCWPGKPRESGMNAYTTHLLTPETSHTTHYFFSVSRTVAEVDRYKNAEFIRDLIRNVFVTEDSPMIADIQSRIGDADLWDFKPASLPGDAGAVRVRHAIRSLLDAEAAQRTATP